MDSNPDPAAPSNRPCPLSEADFLALRQAAGEYTAIQRTVKTAWRSAVTTLIVGVLAVLMTFPFTDWLSTVTAIGVCLVGLVEFAGSGRLRGGQPGAARMLCINQLSFFALITAYCVIQMATFSPSKVQEALSPDMRSALAGFSIGGLIDQMTPLMYLLYGGTIVVSGLIQGRLAWSYRAGGRRLAAFEGHTPAWVRRLLREAHGD